VRVALLAATAVACAVAAVWAQGEKKPNIAVTGCLLSQGYATFILDSARVDGTGEQAAAAAPKSALAPRPANEPVKWVLDEPGNIRSHVGEEVQVIGITDWKRDDPAPTTSPAAPTPHVTVITVKYVSPSCL